MKVCQGKITSKFGDRIHPITGVKKFHNGVDIGCPINTPIYSPCEGIIASTYNHQTGGKTLILRAFGTDDRFAFAHLHGFTKKEGDIVKRGALIAYSGNTGASTGAHLHFGKGINGYWKGGICYDFEYTDPTKDIDIDLNKPIVTTPKEFISDIPHIPRIMETR